MKLGERLRERQRYVLHASPHGSVRGVEKWEGADGMVL